MFERLSGDFNRGYTKAIKDIQEVFRYVEVDLRYHHKKMTGKLAKDLLKCCLDNRESLRESMNGFIRWNTKKECFEFYEREDKS